MNASASPKPVKSTRIESSQKAMATKPDDNHDEWAEFEDKWDETPAKPAKPVPKKLGAKLSKPDHSGASESAPVKKADVAPKAADPSPLPLLNAAITAKPLKLGHAKLTAEPKSQTKVTAKSEPAKESEEDWGNDGWDATDSTKNAKSVNSSQQSLGEKPKSIVAEKKASSDDGWGDDWDSPEKKQPKSAKQTTAPIKHADNGTAAKKEDEWGDEEWESPAPQKSVAKNSAKATNDSSAGAKTTEKASTVSSHIEKKSGWDDDEESWEAADKPAKKPLNKSATVASKASTGAVAISSVNSSNGGTNQKSAVAKTDDDGWNDDAADDWADLDQGSSNKKSSKTAKTVDAPAAATTKLAVDSDAAPSTTSTGL